MTDAYGHLADELIITRGASHALARSAQRACRKGDFTRVAPGVYLRGQDAAQHAVQVRAHWLRILEALAPDSVVGYRSAAGEGAPAVDMALQGAKGAPGLLILSHPTRFNRSLVLPGLRVALVRGAQAQARDWPLGQGRLHCASRERMLLENLTRPRGPQARSLGEGAVRARLTQILRESGATELERIRERAAELAPALDKRGEYARLAALIDALAVTAPPPHRAQPGTGVAHRPDRAEPTCIEQLQALALQLQRVSTPSPPARPIGHAGRALRAFVEAYFACAAIERGLSIEDAHAAVFLGRPPHEAASVINDLLGVYRLALHAPLCDTVPPFGTGFAQALAARHGLLMQIAGNPLPAPARAGPARRSHARMDPQQIHDTLSGGSELARSVPEGLARGLFYAAMIGRVQAFEQGNQRMAGLTLNAELASVGQARIVLPTRLARRCADLRERAVSGHDVRAYVHAMARLQHWSADLDDTDPPRLIAALRCSHALAPAGSANPLLMPDGSVVSLEQGPGTRSLRG